jgi:hypothetical protein
MVTDCPHCEHHKKRAQLWREEAYKQAGHPLPERGWVGLTDEEIMQCLDQGYGINMRLDGFARIIEAKLKEKNT